MSTRVAFPLTTSGAREVEEKMASRETMYSIITMIHSTLSPWMFDIRSLKPFFSGALSIFLYIY